MPARRPPSSPAVPLARALAHAHALAIDLLGFALAPPRCSACDAPTSPLAVFCTPCAASVDRAPPAGGTRVRGRALARAPQPYLYGGALAQAIARFKYERRPDLARPLGDLLWATLASHADRLRAAAAVVVPVPLHAARLAERGYNQSALLAAPVASRLGAPLAARALRRVRDTPRQATLGGAARRANVAGAFAVRDAEAVQDRAILLIDDVETTGATLRACAAALRGSGARSVSAAVLARAEGAGGARTPWEEV